MSEPSIADALAAVAGWQAQGMPLFGVHRIAIALAAEVGRLRTDLDVWLDMNAALAGEVERLRREPEPFVRGGAIPIVPRCRGDDDGA